MGQLRTMWTAGQITADALLCQEGSEEWVPAASLLDVVVEPEVVQPASSEPSRNSNQYGAAKTILAIVSVAIAGVVVWWSTSNPRWSEQLLVKNPYDEIEQTLEAERLDASKKNEAAVLEKLELIQVKMRPPTPTAQSAEEWLAFQKDLYTVDPMGMEKGHTAKVFHAARRSVMGVHVAVENWIEKEKDSYLARHVKEAAERSYEEAEAAVASAIETLRSAR